jgi:hypothetical protein
VARIHRGITLMMAVGAGLLALLAAAIIVKKGPDIVGFVLAAVCALIAFGFWKDWRWLCRTVAGLLLLGALVMPLGVFSPFSAGDYAAAGREPPSTAGTLAWLIPAEIALLLLAFTLDWRPNVKPAPKPG